LRNWWRSDLTRTPSSSFTRIADEDDDESRFHLTALFGDRQFIARREEWTTKETEDALNAVPGTLLLGYGRKLKTTENTEDTEKERNKGR
jgi:hypothetical protein